MRRFLHSSGTPSGEAETLTASFYLPIILNIYDPVLMRRGIFMRCGRERARGQEPG